MKKTQKDFLEFDGNSYVQDIVTLDENCADEVTNQPELISGSKIFGYIEFLDGRYEKIIFDGKFFTSKFGSPDDLVHVRYYIKRI